MVIILVELQFDAWLDAPAGESMEFMRQFPAEHLVAEPAGRARDLMS